LRFGFAQKADVIVITGDFISLHRVGFERELVPGLRRLQARDGVFGILGNHDFWGNKPDLVAGAIEAAGVRELRNAVQTFTRGDSRFHLAGIDDFWYGKPDILGTANQVPAGEACVVLGHEPDFAIDVAPTGKFGLMLSGHSHGGQVALPFWGPVHLPPHCRLFPRGFYDVGAMKLYTNRGIGTVGIPLRFCARP
jgi:predicted MPP superfamily phosphohydrolase